MTWTFDECYVKNDIYTANGGLRVVTSNGYNASRAPKPCYWYKSEPLSDALARKDKRIAELEQAVVRLREETWSQQRMRRMQENLERLTRTAPDTEKRMNALMGAMRELLEQYSEEDGWYED